MRVALVTARGAGAHGGAEVLYNGLEAALRKEGQDVTRVELPFDESRFETILEGYRRARALDLHDYDLVISTKSPTYNVRHRRHVVYLVHTVRVFYDMFDSWTDGSDIARHQRDQIRELDFSALSAVPDDRRFAIGEEVVRRLETTLALSAVALHPALPDAERFHEGPFRYLLHAGRLHPWKRVDLVIEAFRDVSADVPLLITGTGEDRERLQALAAGDDRIRFLGDVPRAALYDLYSGAIAVPCVPVSEDFGYVALEAMTAGKPVITATDSGEPCRLVTHEETGLVTEPRRGDLARAIEKLITDTAAAQRLGKAARARALRIRWPEVARRLLGAICPRVEGSEASRDRQLRVLISDNQPIDPPVGGGRIRLHGLYANLPSDLDPVYVGTYDWPGPGYRGIRHEGTLLEVTVPQSPAHFAAHHELQREAPSLTMDTTFPVLAPLSGGFTERVAYEARRSDVIILSHPWVWTTLRSIRGIQTKPVIYDAHNVEGRLKRELLGHEPVARSIADYVSELEQEVCRHAAAVFVCSEEDGEALRQLYGIPARRLYVVPNGVRTDRLIPPTAGERNEARARLGASPDQPVVVFVGSQYPPNVEAARFICGSVASRHPEALFLLIGGCASTLTPAETPVNVRPFGVVKEAVRNEAYAAADLAINPMRIGSGTNIKMLDFFSAGLATIATPTGARGIPGAGRAFLVSSLEDFSSAVEELLRSRPLRLRLGQAARRLAVERFDWRRIASVAARAIRQSTVGSGAAVRLRSRAPTAQRTPRIALMTTWNTRCGIADYSASLVKSWGETLDWRVYAEATPVETGREPRAQRNWNYGLADLSGLSRRIREDAIQALLVQYHPAFFDETRLRALLQLCREAGVRVAVTMHAARSVRLDAPHADGLAGADRIVVHHRSDARLLAEQGLGRSVRVIPQGVTRFERRDRDRSKSSLGLQGSFVIGHFGYLRPHKGTLELIEAFDVLAARSPRVRLLLACAQYPGAESEQYRRVCSARIAASPFAQRIHATFEYLPLNQMGYLLQACDLVVYPYHPSRESSSAAVRLALGAGRAIAVSDSAIFEDVAEVAEALPSLRPRELAERLNELAGDKSRLREAERRLESFAAERDWSRIAASTWGLLRQLATGASGPAAGDMSAGADR